MENDENEKSDGSDRGVSRNNPVRINGSSDVNALYRCKERPGWLIGYSGHEDALFRIQ